MSSVRARFFAACCAGLCLFAAPAQALLPTGAGALDPTFGNGGVVIANPTPGIEQTWGNALQPDGKLVIAASLRDSGGVYSFGLLRYLDNGSPDPAFGVGGMGVFPMTQKDGPGLFSVGLDGAGRIFVAGYSQPDATFHCAVWAATASGQIDTSFGTSGVYRFQLHAGIPSICESLVVQRDGKIVVHGYEYENSSLPIGFVIRLLPNGTPDPTFNGQGVVTLASPAGFYPDGIALDAGGAIYVSGGNTASTSTGIVFKLRNDGSPDPAFGTGGRFESSLGGSGHTEFFGIAIQPDGRIALAGLHGGQLVVVRLTAAGALDSSFGNGGFFDFNVPTGIGGFAREIAIQRDGKYVVEVRALLAGDIVRFGVARVTTAGTLDPSFGVGGTVVIPALAPGNDYITGIALGPDGKIWLSGNVYPSANDQAFGIVRLLGDEITTLVTEFFNSNLIHYFITADPNEAAAVDAGAAGPGWSRTAQTFKSGGPNKACRFYGTPDINPGTGLRRGPNSHFYTLDIPECAQVKQDPGWHFESYDFNAWPKQGGTCPVGTIGVMRVYNGRFAQNDSNHRYTTSAMIYDQMIAQGWSGEGTVFCAPV